MVAVLKLKSVYLINLDCLLQFFEPVITAFGREPGDCLSTLVSSCFPGSICRLLTDWIWIGMQNNFI